MPSSPMGRGGCSGAVCSLLYCGGEALLGRMVFLHLDLSLAASLEEVGVWPAGVAGSRSEGRPNEAGTTRAAKTVNATCREE